VEVDARRRGAFAAVLGVGEQRPAVRADAVVQTALDGRQSTGTGRFDEGLAWGWRLFSPSWTGEWGLAHYPSAYGEHETIVMLFTDGQSTAYDSEVLTGPERGRTSPDGRAKFGHNRGWPMGFAHLVDLCGRMKAAGVRIIMMQLEGNDDFTSNAKACASSPEDHFSVDGLTTLETALSSLALARAGGVRLVR